jgi:hypothetical protein
VRHLRILPYANRDAEKRWQLRRVPGGKAAPYDLKSKRLMDRTTLHGEESIA